VAVESAEHNVGISAPGGSGPWPSRTRSAPEAAELAVELHEHCARPMTITSDAIRSPTESSGQWPMSICGGGPSEASLRLPPMSRCQSVGRQEPG
jgi:hypothetical protein